MHFWKCLGKCCFLFLGNSIRKSQVPSPPGIQSIPPSSIYSVPTCLLMSIEECPRFVLVTAWHMLIYTALTKREGAILWKLERQRAKIKVFCDISNSNECIVTEAFMGKGVLHQGLWCRLQGFWMLYRHGSSVVETSFLASEILKSTSSCGDSIHQTNWS